MESYVTFAHSDVSALGCLVLCNSLKLSSTDKQISVLVNSSVSKHIKNVLIKSFDNTFDIEHLCFMSDGNNLYDIHGEYEKLKCWLLESFVKCVFLESDVLVLENIDDLFERSEFSAVSDPRWPDCFDAGVFVYSPSLTTYKKLVNYSIENRILNNSVQCLLNMFFCDWSCISVEHKIPFIYNCQLNSTFYTHTPALVHFGSTIKAARLGNAIFQMMQPSSLGDVTYQNWNRIWTEWWRIFNEMVKPALESDETSAFFPTYSAQETDQNIDRNQQACPQYSHQEVSFEHKTEVVSTSQNFFFPQPANQNVVNQQSVITYPSQQTYFYPHHQPFSSNSTDSKSLRVKTKRLLKVPTKESETSKDVHNSTASGATNESTCESLNYSSDCDNQHSYTNTDVVQYIDEITESLSDDSASESDIRTSTVAPDGRSFKEEQENIHRLCWERGEIDYMGKDSFDNIIALLNTKLNSNSESDDVNDEE